MEGVHLSFGTYQVEEPTIITSAVDSGYRRFDCAPIYGNEKMVGSALAASKVARSELFIQTKVWFDAMRTDRVRESVERSIDYLTSQFGVSGYLDCVLVHWPTTDEDINAATWRILAKMVGEGKVIHIGISNFWEGHVRSLRSAIQETGVRPYLNQIEVNPETFDASMLSFMEAEGINVECYKPFGRGKCLGNELVVQMAVNMKCTTSELLLAFLKQRGLWVTCKSSNSQRLKANFETFYSRKMELTDRDMAILETRLSTAEILRAKRVDAENAESRLSHLKTMT